MYGNFCSPPPPPYLRISWMRHWWEAPNLMSKNNWAGGSGSALSSSRTVSRVSVRYWAFDWALSSRRLFRGLGGCSGGITMTARVSTIRDAQCRTSRWPSPGTARAEHAHTARRQPAASVSLDHRDDKPDNLCLYGGWSSLSTVFRSHLSGGVSVMSHRSRESLITRPYRSSAGGRFSCRTG